MLDREAVEAAAVAGALATYLPDGTRLSELLTTDQYEQLSAYLSRHDMNIETFEAYQPWAITQGLFADYSEYSPWSPGVDLILASQVDTGRMRAFETIEEQLALTLAPIEEQVVELLEMIENPPGPWRSDFDTLVHWWSSGDSQNLAELMTASLGPEDGESYRAMLTDRNRRWAIIAEELPRNNDNALIVAGVGHMVGNASLPALLAERGYTIEILQPKTLAATVRQRPLHTESYFTRR